MNTEPGKPAFASPASAGAEPGSGPAAGFLPDPARGRVFTTARLIRSTDVTPSGRLRFDALARYLQEAAEDDVTDSSWREPCGWLLRRCTVTVRSYPAYSEQVRIRTFCSATGPRWAERTTTIAADTGDVIQARAVWVAVDTATGQPRPLGPGFLRVYGESTGGRRVSGRLSHPRPDGSRSGREWPLRASDFDPAGHVNNCIHWAAVEDALTGLSWLPASAEMEYHRPILPGQRTHLVTSEQRGHMRAWLLAGGQRLASALLSHDGPAAVSGEPAG